MWIGGIYLHVLAIGWLPYISFKCLIRWFKIRRQKFPKEPSVSVWINTPSIIYGYLCEHKTHLPPAQCVRKPLITPLFPPTAHQDQGWDLHMVHVHTMAIKQQTLSGKRSWMERLDTGVWGEVQVAEKLVIPFGSISPPFPLGKGENESRARETMQPLMNKSLPQ